MSQPSRSKNFWGKKWVKIAIVCVTILLLLVILEKKRQSQKITTTPSIPPVPANNICSIKSAQKLSNGGDSDWSRVNNLITFMDWNKKGIYQLYTIKPDGSDKTCLSCTTQPGEPAVDRNKTSPTWDPSGRFIISLVEIPNDPMHIINKANLFSELASNGIWSDIYATTPDGKHWYKLTDTTSKHIDGALYPLFSADGHQLLWSRIVKTNISGGLFGIWRLMMADFVVSNGIPHLDNIQDITPSSFNNTFIEPHGFSPDGTHVIFTSSRDNTNKLGMDIYTMDLATKEVKNLTHSPYWDEHATYTLNGGKIIYMSSSPYPNVSFKTDLLMMNTDGSNIQQLTHFNVPGYVESQNKKVMPLRPRWNNDGTSVTLTLQLSDHYPARELWRVDFQGACGMQ